MKTLPKSRVGPVLLAACFAAASPVRAEPGHVFPPLTPAEIGAIAAAVPAHARVSPAKPRALLVFYRTDVGGYVHSSIPYVNEALRQLGARTGAWKADFSDDMSVFTPENLARYDAVVFQNTTNLAFKDPAQRRALIAFVKSGRGFVGIHAASDSFYTWPQAQEMLGGVFHNHPWKSIDTEAVKIDDPANPVVAAFGGKGFWIREEIYEITGPYSRDRERVLLSLDMSKAENFRPPENLARTDADFPIAWIKNYGRGRVFYSSIGHNPNLFQVPEIMQFYLDGIQFATGDLPADAAPIPALPLQDRGDRRALAPDYLDKLAAYNFGPDRTPVTAVDIYLRAQGPKVYPAMEQSLLALLARPDLKEGGRDYAIRTLAIIGSDASVPTLRGLLGDRHFGSTAVMTLFEIPGRPSATALLEALDSAKPPVLITVIGTVGRRGLTESIPRLTELATSTDQATASAALTALGDLGTGDSLRALHGMQPAAALTNARFWAEISAAARAQLDGPAVTGMYREILDSQAPDSLRIAALKGLAGVNPLDPIVFEMLRDPSAKVRFTAANLISVPHNAKLTEGFLELDPTVQVVILDAITVRRTPNSLALVSQGLRSADEDVRMAAIIALGSVRMAPIVVRPEVWHPWWQTGAVDGPVSFDDLGDPAAIAPLLSLLDGPKNEADAAADSLGRLRAPGMIDALLGAMSGASPAKKAALLQILAARVDHRVYPAALASVDDGNAAVRAAAFGAIAATSRQNDLPTVLALLPKTRTAAERRSMERALLEVVREAPNPDVVADAINQTLATTHGPARYSLLVALALVGTDHARDILAGIVRSPSAQDRREAIRAISGSQNPRLDILLIDAARSDPEHTERILALRDYLDMLQVPNGRTNEEVAAGYATAWSLADRAEEKDAIIAALRHMATNATDAQAAKLEASRARH